MGTDEGVVQELFRELSIDHVIKQYPYALSGGERQRVLESGEINHLESGEINQ